MLIQNAKTVAVIVERVLILKFFGIIQITKARKVEVIYKRLFGGVETLKARKAYGELIVE